MKTFNDEVFPAAGEALRGNLRRYAHVPAKPGWLAEIPMPDPEAN